MRVELLAILYKKKKLREKKYGGNFFHEEL